MEVSAAGREQYGVHACEKRGVDGDGEPAGVHGRRIAMEEKHAVDKLLRRDGDKRVKGHDKQPKPRVGSGKGQKRLRVAVIGK